MEDVLATLEQSGTILQQGWSPQCERVPAGDGEWGVLKTTSVQDGYFLEAENKRLPKALAPKPSIEVRAGDLLMTCAGPRSRCGVVCLVKKTRSKLMFSGKIYRFRPDPRVIDPSFFTYQLRTHALQLQIDAAKTGISESGLNMTRERFFALQLIAPPIAEQKRIAKKLDALLAQVDTLKARIDAVPALLKRFRSAVLSAAINGELTGEESCCWDAVTLEDLVENSSVGIVRSADEQSDQLDGRHPYLKMNNINQDWGFNTEKIVGVQATKDEMHRYELKGGDWLFNTRNSVELVGKSCVWNGPEGCVFNNNILRIRFVADVLPEYVEIWFRSPQGRARLNKIKSATTSVAAIYQKTLMKEVLALPAISQQREIVQQVEQLFAFADQLEAKISTAQKRIDPLTQSLLAKAFRGELVPQHPNDEPASVLLERIRAQRAAAPKPKRGRKAPVN